jgi:hypothetical protein
VLARGDRTIVLLNPAKLFSGKERLALEQAADGATGA